MRPSEVLSELVADVRRHAEAARKLHATIQSQTSEAGVANRVRLRAKADTYSHAAELVADAALRLPEERNGWADAHVAMQNLQVYLSRHHDLNHLTFTFGGITDIYIWVEGAYSHGKPINLDVSEPLTNDKIDAAVKVWRGDS